MAQDLLGSAWHGCYFDGTWQPGTALIDVFEPATGEKLATVGTVAADQFVKIEAKAIAAQKIWAATPPSQRARILRNAAAILEQHAQEAAGWVIRETGGVSFKGGMEVHATVEEFYVAAALLIQSDGAVIDSPDPNRLSFARRVPVGIVGVITPWNVPLGLAIRSVASALALGNSVILKPDVHTPVSGGILLARVLEEAGLPPGVFCVIPGGAEIGEALVTAPAVRVISFTGSTAVGRRVGELAGRHLKKALLELGGNCPILILDDCDVEAAASAGAFGSFFHQGQICMAVSRHIVDRKVAPAYMEILARKAAALPVGNPVDPSIMIGPMINRKQRDRVHGIVTDSLAMGAKLLAGGSFDELFYRPTVLADVTPEMPAFSQELFGPVAPITIAENEEHAIALANATEYGLSAAIHTGSEERGMRVARQLRSGMVHINDQTINDGPMAPMGGMGQSGNGSRFSSLTAWDEFTEWQWFTSSSTPTRFPF